jgi:Flp pilus assembly protein TadB
MPAVLDFVDRNVAAGGPLFDLFIAAAKENVLHVRSAFAFVGLEAAARLSLHRYFDLLYSTRVVSSRDAA